MNILPNAQIKILRGCPINTYEHTLFFQSKWEQEAYFTSLEKYGFGDFSRVRAEYNNVIVPVAADALYDCNYLMFRNTSFDDKWFYAFLKKIEYVNTTVSRVTFELDVIQTWMFDYELKECFIEREHSASDKIGDNIVPEGLNIGPMQVLDSNFAALSADTIVVTANKAIDGTPPTWWIEPGTYAGGTYWGSYATAFPVSGAATRLQAIVDASVNDPEAKIGSIYLSGAAASGGVQHVSIPERKQAIIPKNNKLFAAPFCSYMVQCPGGSISGKYETLSALDVDYIGTKDANTVFSVIVHDTSLGEMGGTISCSGYPILGWVTDAYGEWCASKAQTLIGSVIKSFGGSNEEAAIGSNFSAPIGAVIGGAALGNSAMILGGAAALLKAADDSIRALSSPDEMHGAATGGASLLAAGKFGVYTYAMGLLPSYAKSIDDYFTRYGYACKRLKTPNIHVRKRFTFVKTVGCNIRGYIPSDDAEKICKIFDSGVTFWVNPNDVGNYELDNSPIEGGR